MRNFSRTLSAVVAIVFVVGAARHAGSRKDGKREIDVGGTIVALGASVPRGSYTLRWNRVPGTEDVQVAITRGSEVLAEGKGTWVAAETPSPYESLVYDSGNGATELTEIRFTNSTDRIRLDAAAARVAARRHDGSDEKTVE